MCGCLPLCSCTIPRAKICERKRERISHIHTKLELNPHATQLLRSCYASQAFKTRSTFSHNQFHATSCSVSQSFGAKDLKARQSLRQSCSVMHILCAAVCLSDHVCVSSISWEPCSPQHPKLRTASMSQASRRGSPTVRWVQCTWKGPGSIHRTLPVLRSRVTCPSNNLFPMAASRHELGVGTQIL